VTRIIICMLAASLGACATQTDESPKGPPAMEAPDAESSFGGQVLQRIRTGSYAYLEVRTASGEQRWVVTLGEGAPEGSEVEVRAFGVRHDFKSRRLDRTFDHLVFGIVHNKS
jgi:hypothetical protein